MSNINDRIREPSITLIDDVTKIKGPNGVLYAFPFASIKVKDNEIKIIISDKLDQDFTFDELNASDQLGQSDAEGLIDEYINLGYFGAGSTSGSSGGSGPANPIEFNARYVYDDGDSYKRVFQVYTIDEDSGAAVVTYYDAPGGSVISLVGNPIPINDTTPLVESEMAYIPIDDSQVFTLANGFETSAAGSPARVKPADAVGVYVTCKITDTLDPTQLFIRYTDNPSITPTTTWGEYFYDGQTLAFGLAPGSQNGFPTELDELRFIAPVGVTADLVLQYYKRPV